MNNTRLLVLHVSLYAATTNFAASFLYWERLLAERHGEQQREERTKGGGGHGPSQPQAAQGSGLSLRKLVVVEAVQLALSVIVLGCQVSFDRFSNQYVYLLPGLMFASETYIHFGGGRAE